MVCSLGFLRSAALFYQYLSGVLAPPELNNILPPNQGYSETKQSFFYILNGVKEEIIF